jgi:hypothetical protein
VDKIHPFLIDENNVDGVNNNNILEIYESGIDEELSFCPFIIFEGFKLMESLNEYFHIRIIIHRHHIVESFFQPYVSLLEITVLRRCSGERFDSLFFDEVELRRSVAWGESLSAVNMIDMSAFVVKNLKLRKKVEVNACVWPASLTPMEELELCLDVDGVNACNGESIFGTSRFDESKDDNIEDKEDYPWHMLTSTTISAYKMFLE